MIADVVTGELDVQGAMALLPDEEEAPEQLDDGGDFMGVDAAEVNPDAALPPTPARRASRASSSRG